ncbi:MAG: dihydroorotase [Deltaproteobacteria bacterium]|nr:dihydroorotase [Deltaproteobacteria bacterium]
MRIEMRNGRLIDPARGMDEPRDLFLADGRIAADAPPGRLERSLRAERTIDAKGKWVVPGLVDMHVHLREPGEEYKETIETGLRAAAAGGFAAVASMPNTQPPNDARSVTEHVLRRAAAVRGARCLPIAAITIGREGKHLTEFGELLEAGAVGFSDDGTCVADAGLFRRALEYARSFDTLILQHAQEPRLTVGALAHEGPRATRLGLAGWPSVAEELIVARDLLLAAYTDARLHIQHVSSAGTVDLLRAAKAKGVRVTAEVTPHHLWLTDEAIETYDTNAKVNPPLREEHDRGALREALRDGTIDCIATDHAPHSVLEKVIEFDRAAFGVVGLETALPLGLALVRDRVLTPLRLIETMSTAPARALRVPGGRLAVGDPADVTIVDPERPFRIDPSSFVSMGRNTPFGGYEVPGRAVATVVGGDIVFELA